MTRCSGTSPDKDAIKVYVQVAPDAAVGEAVIEAAAGAQASPKERAL